MSENVQTYPMPTSSAATLPGIHGSPWQTLLDFYFKDTETERRFGLNRLAPHDRVWRSAWVGDEPAETLGSAIISGKLSRSQFERGLRTLQLSKAPEPVREFIEPILELPDGLDIEAAERGAAVYRELPPSLPTTHGIVAGFVVAAITPNAAIPLSLNANVARATQQRYMRTARYVVDLMAPGALRPYGSGFRSACRVRLVHGFVRSEISRHFDWNRQAYGVPIHAGALLTAAAVTGTWALVWAELQGCRFSQREKDDMAQFTAWQAHVHGVPSDLLVYTDVEWRDLIYRSVYYGGLPRAEDTHRARSVLGPLLGNGYPLTQRERLDDLFNAHVAEATRRILGDAMSDAFGVRGSRVGTLMRAPASLSMQALVRAHSERRRSRVHRRVYARVCDRWWDKMVPGMVQKVTGARDTDYSDSARVA